MAIYLDSNPMYGWQTLGELDRLALAIVAGQQSQAIRIPWLVMEELRARHERHLTVTADRLDAALRDVERTFDEQENFGYDPAPDVEGQLASWVTRFEDFAQIIEPVAEDMTEGFRREIHGIAPAKNRVPDKPGMGGRDAAIWLAIARDHNVRNEVGHFITADKGCLNDDGSLRGQMRDDLTSDHPLHTYRSVGSFLEILGRATEVEVEVADLEVAAGSVKAALEAATTVPRAVYEEPIFDRYRFWTVVVDAAPVKVIRARRYERAAEALTLVDSNWAVTANVYHQDRDEDPSSVWEGFDSNVRLTGQIQMYLPHGDSAESVPQVVGARLRSDTTVSMAKDGTLMSLTQSDLWETLETLE